MKGFWVIVVLVFVVCFVAALNLAQPSQAKTGDNAVSQEKKWEYKWVDAHPYSVGSEKGEGRLNDLGKNHWRVVPTTFSGNYILMERDISDAPAGN